VRYLVLSDIHANLAALEAVLDDAPDFDELWCLGDLVGYGPNPNECIERVRGFSHTSLAGNHDWAALGKLDLNSFNTVARAANEWTQQELTASSRTYLDGLSPSLQLDSFALAHASPREPVWEYIMDATTACQNFEYFSASFCLVGHTHVPVLFERLEERQRCNTVLPPLPDPVELGPRRAIINPGSVGQPRDGDPRASYALLDTEEKTWAFHRVPYPIEITQERMRARGLPRRLVNRLEIGR
jgi:diadenosine tetraphosphatase ApaH/serine/threonine PP2A family protein phosphatase